MEYVYVCNRCSHDFVVDVLTQFQPICPSCGNTEDFELDDSNLPMEDEDDEEPEYLPDAVWDEPDGDS